MGGVSGNPAQREAGVIGNTKVSVGIIVQLEQKIEIMNGFISEFDSAIKELR